MTQTSAAPSDSVEHVTLEKTVVESHESFSEGKWETFYDLNLIANDSEKFITLFPQNNVPFFLSALGEAGKSHLIEGALERLRLDLQQIQDGNAILSSDGLNANLPQLPLELLQDNSLTLEKILGVEKCSLLLGYIKAERTMLASQEISIIYGENETVTVTARLEGFNAREIYRGDKGNMPSRLNRLFGQK